MMKEKQMIEAVKEYAKKFFSGDKTGHDWSHTYRVWKTSLKIGKTEKNADMLVVQLGALLHDTTDWKLNKNQKESILKVSKLLDYMGIDKAKKNSIMFIIDNVSFKGAGIKDRMNSIEGKIVQDADRVDATGAIGIARAFIYGGSKGREMYNPKIKPKMHKSFRSYKNSKSTTINHFYEKSLLLKDRMNTKKGREIAEIRSKYMKEYIKHFVGEWEGKE